MVRIAVVNRTRLPRLEVQSAIDACQEQIDRHFAPAWGLSADLAAERSMISGTPTVILQEDPTVDGALGYHSRKGGAPIGFVFTKLAAALGEPWSSILSHEILEMILDPLANLTVLGPHPTKAGRMAGWWREACDPVQGELYEVRGEMVSSFVLPAYFTEEHERGLSNDWLHTNLKSFGVNQGGYAGFHDLQTNKIEQVFGAKSAKKLAAKQSYVTRTKIRRVVHSGMR